MNFNLDNNAIVFFENSTDINRIKKYIREKSTIEFTEGVKFRTVDSFIRDEVELFWPMLGNGVFPKIISKNVSMCILYKIIGDRRMFDDYFSGINSADIYIAQNIYSIMNQAARYGIPAVEIAPIIERFKRGIIKKNTYRDLENTIREYRSILNLFGATDNSMIIEKYTELLQNDEYGKSISNKRFYIGNKIYENRAVYSKIVNNRDIQEKLLNGEVFSISGVNKVLALCKEANIGSSSKSGKGVSFFSKELDIENTELSKIKIEVADENEADGYIVGEYILRKIDICSENEIVSNLFADEIAREKKYETADISEVRRKINISELNNYKYKGMVEDLDFDNYFNMEDETGRVIKGILDSGNSEEDIVLIIPRINSAVVSMVDKIRDIFKIKIDRVSESEKINSNKDALSSLIAYAVRNDFSSFLNEDDKVEFVKFVLDGIIRNREEKKFLDASVIDDDIYSECGEEMFFTSEMDEDYIEEEYFNYDMIEAFNSEVGEYLDKGSYNGAEQEEKSVKNEFEKRFGMDIYKIKKSETNYIHIRKNLNKFMRIIIDDERILPPKPQKKEYISEYIKKFFKLYGEINEKTIIEVSQICDLISELQIFGSKEKSEEFILSEEKKIEYIKNYLSVFTSLRRRIEKVDLKNISVIPYREYLQMKVDKNIKIIFDAQSPIYDEKIENELNTEVAYLGDSILSEIPDDSITKRADLTELGKLYSRLQNKKINGNLSLLFGNEEENGKIYILNSYTSLSGYEQENIFYEKLMSSVEN